MVVYLTSYREWLVSMNLIRYEPGRYYLETVEIREHERPPMVTIPEYRAKFGYTRETSEPVSVESRAFPEA